MRCAFRNNYSFLYALHEKNEVAYFEVYNDVDFNLYLFGCIIRVAPLFTSTWFLRVAQTKKEVGTVDTTFYSFVARGAQIQQRDHTKHIQRTAVAAPL